MGKSRLGKVVALVLVVSVGVVFSAGCFGKFQLTRKVYDINKSVEDKYLRSAVTWLLVIIPVYGLAGFLGFILFNVIEFWSGENPIVSGPQTRVYAKGDDRAVMTIDREDGATVATVARYRAGSLVSTMRIRDDGGGPGAGRLSRGCTIGPRGHPPGGRFHEEIPMKFLRSWVQDRGLRFKLMMVMLILLACSDR